jgi:penicillin-binding protein 1A
MRDLGFITSPEFLANISKPVKVYKYASSQAYGDAPYFTEYVRRQLEERFGQDLYTEGLTIYTTLDSRAQAVAERAVREHLPVIQEAVRDYHVNEGKLRALLDEGFIRKHKYETLARDSVFVDSLINAKAAAQVALVSLDPGTGHILAWIGGRDFGESKFDRVYQGNGRQPGSAFKPFVYTVAIDNGWKTTDEELNQPVVVNMPDGSRWNPQNYDHSVGGATTFRVALQRSLNLVTVRVLQGKIQNPQLVVDYAHKMGIKTELQPVDALALGASDVKPIDLTSAFGVFANGGILVDPISILRVEDKHGNILWQHQPNRQEVLRKETAYIMTSMLQSVLATEDSVTGTGVGARWRYNFLRPAGGKTGTTNDYSDAWFVGFTPQIVTGVWIGIDDYTISLGNGQTGSRAAMPIWAPYMKAVHDTLALPILDFEMPIGVVRREVCMVTKDLANDVCPRIKEEVFFEGNSPTEHCRVHVGLTNGLRERESQGRKRVRF